MNKRYKKFFKEENTSNYNWLQISLDSNQQNLINFHQLQNLIPKDNLSYKDNSESGGRETDCHVTLFYGLCHKEDFYSIEAALTNFGQIEIITGKINKFSHDNCDVIYIEVESQQLNDIHYYIKDNFENENTYSIYTPHITLAYVQPNSCDFMIGNTLIDIFCFGKNLTFNEVIFCDTEGERYLIDTLVK